MENSKLFVGNLDYSVDFRELRQLFGEHGEVRFAKVIQGRGFGFVEMASDADAQNAKAALDGTDFKGRTMKVDIARPRQPAQ